MAVSAAASNTANASVDGNPSEWALSVWHTQEGSNGYHRYLYGDGVWDGSGGLLTFRDDGFGGYTADADIISGVSYGGSSLFTIINMTGWNISATGASTGTFECVEGSYGALVGVNVCGSYTYGGSSKDIDESSYNSVTGVTTIGGNDIAHGDHISGNEYWGKSINDMQFSAVLNPLLGTFGVDYLVFSSRTATESGLTGDGITLTFVAVDDVPIGEVPVPASAWLFGSALLALAGSKRKMTGKEG